MQFPIRFPQFKFIACFWAGLHWPAHLFKKLCKRRFENSCWQQAGSSCKCRTEHLQGVGAPWVRLASLILRAVKGMLSSLSWSLEYCSGRVFLCREYFSLILHTHWCCLGWLSVERVCFLVTCAQRCLNPCVEWRHGAHSPTSLVFCLGEAALRTSLASSVLFLGLLASHRELFCVWI